MFEGLIVVAKEVAKGMLYWPFLLMSALLLLELGFGLYWINRRPRVSRVLLGVPALKLASLVGVTLYVWIKRYYILQDPSGIFHDSLAHFSLLLWWIMLSLLGVLVLSEGWSRMSRDRKLWKAAQ